jgi:hypothetical protein
MLFLDNPASTVILALYREPEGLLEGVGIEKNR